MLAHQLATGDGAHVRGVGQRLATDLHVVRARRGGDVAHARDFVLAVLEVRVHGDGHVGEQRPRRRGPHHQLALGVVRQREREEHGVGLHRVVTLRQLVRRQRGPAARAIRQDLVAAVQQLLVVQLPQQPPHRLDVVARVGDVGVLVVEPVGDAVRQRFPVAFVREHAFAAQRVELRHAVRLDLRLAGDVQLLLDFDFDGQAVRVPPRDAGDALPQHGVVAADQVFDRAREDVMDAGAAVGRRRPFEKHERRPVASRLLHLLEQALVLPGREELLLQPVRRELRIEGGVRLHPWPSRALSSASWRSSRARKRAR